MSLLISAHQISKTLGEKKLFDQLSFGLHEKQRLALLGPNGAGKSTLLKILAGLETVDQGDVSPKKNLKLAYVTQEDIYNPEDSILKAALAKVKNDFHDSNEAQVQVSIQLSMAGFDDFERPVRELSGGWRKRLSLAIAFSKEPELLLLDEPTNHMDWDGILWLENQLKIFKETLMIVSHDREFLKNQCHEFMELNRFYKNGYFSVRCAYEDFLTQREEYVQGLKSLQESMSNKARREVEWLRAGVKARTTKGQARMKEAHQLLDDLNEVNQRNQAARAKVNIDIDSAGKRSKKFVELTDLSISYGDKKILNSLTLTMGPKTCIGLLGNNASGKTSLLKVISKDAKNYSGQIFWADDLKIVYFDQKREGLDKSLSIVEFLGDGSDHVPFKGRSLHVASYASSFLFDSQKMNMPIERLSGGEQARLLIAKLLLQPADVLILDEPTNDLDIATIEILEESLNSFPGLVLVVSHDRYFLKEMADKFLALDGTGGWTMFADMDQWLKSKNNESNPKQTVEKSIEKTKSKGSQKVKLSYKEKRQLETIEEDIASAENELQQAQEDFNNNQNFSDHELIKTLTDNISKKQSRVDELYSTWSELEEKVKSMDS